MKEEEFLNLVCDDLRYYLDQSRASLHGYVLMPDHVHLVISLLDGQDVSELVKVIKQRTTKVWNRRHGENGKIWQKGFYDHVIQDERDFMEHLEYMHKNPIKHGLAEGPEQYRWSSYAEYEREGKDSPLKVTPPEF